MNDSAMINERMNFVSFFAFYRKCKSVKMFKTMLRRKRMTILRYFFCNLFLFLLCSLRAVAIRHVDDNGRSSSSTSLTTVIFIRSRFVHLLASKSCKRLQFLYPKNLSRIHCKRHTIFLLFFFAFSTRHSLCHFFSFNTRMHLFSRPTRWMDF